jgi:hypothetical protein
VTTAFVSQNKAFIGGIIFSGIIEPYKNFLPAA